MGLLKGDSEPATPPTSLSGSRATGFNAILDRGSEFEGKLTFEGTVRIDGKFKGEIKSDANLVIGESGKVEADINVATVSISGEVKGNITAKTKVEVHAPAVVRGNIHTPSLVIEEGVTFEGSCIMEKTGTGTISAGKTQKPKFEVASMEGRKGADELR
ncbi:MAG TPA: polymer-forming cytoskeletal protein [Bdellovibrionota bacterium]|nr:polymer-forming cytoskeletal protein [Bdellovibrionota bacterium]